MPLVVYNAKFISANKFEWFFDFKTQCFNLIAVNFQNLLDIIKLFDRYLTLVEAFGGGKKFAVELKNDFAHFVNLNNSTREFLWLYIEEKLRKGQKMLSESVWMPLLDEVIGLLKFVLDKDIFEGFYRKHLAKNLLLSKNYNDDEFAIEKAMISKLKVFFWLN